MTKLNKFNQDIIIGTAQFNKKYGLSKSKLTIKQKYNYLDEIIKLNCYGIDTAYAYDKAQNNIGHWIKINKSSPKIFTKITGLDNLEKMKKQFYECLSQLNLNSIEGLYIHNQDGFKYKIVSELAKYLLKKNQIKKFGISIYDVDAIPNNPVVSILQVPGNIFNQNILNSDELHKFYERGGHIYIRSIFIQGLLLMNINKIPRALNDLKKPIKEFYNIAKEMKIHPIVLCMQSIKYIYPKCKLIIGANNISQLNEVLNKNNIILHKSDAEYILNFGKKYEHKLWDPRNWKKY